MIQLLTIFIFFFFFWSFHSLITQMFVMHAATEASFLYFL